MDPKIIISDPHFHNYKENSRVLASGVNSRLQDLLDAARLAKDLALAEGCTSSLWGGDLFNTRGVLKPSVLNDVVALLIEFAEARLEPFVIPGNHDKETLSGGASSTDTFAEIPGLEAFLEPGIITQPDGCRVAGVPYIHDMEAFKEVFQRLAQEKPDIFLIHQGIDEFAGHGYGESGLTADWLAKATDAWVFAGHYHTPNRQGRIVSIGAIAQHTFGDEGDERGVWILKDDELDFRPIASPRFMTVRIEKTAELKKLDVAGRFVRIITANVKKAEEMKQAATDAGALNVVLQLEKVYATAHAKTVKLGAPETMLEEFIELQGGALESRKDALLTLFRKICL